jgi:hypothetical protein
VWKRFYVLENIYGRFLSFLSLDAAVGQQDLVFSCGWLLVDPGVLKLALILCFHQYFLSQRDTYETIQMAANDGTPTASHNGGTTMPRTSNVSAEDHPRWHLRYRKIGTWRIRNQELEDQLQLDLQSAIDLPSSENPLVKVQSLLKDYSRMKDMFAHDVFDSIIWYSVREFHPPPGEPAVDIYRFNKNQTLNQVLVGLRQALNAGDERLLRIW